MSNFLSLEQRAKTGDLNADFLMRQYKLDKIAKYLQLKSFNPKPKQSEIAKDLAISTSTSQTYSREIKMHSPYRRLQSSNTNT